MTTLKYNKTKLTCWSSSCSWLLVIRHLSTSQYSILPWALGGPMVTSTSTTLDNIFVSKCFQFINSLILLFVVFLFTRDELHVHIFTPNGGGWIRAEFVARRLSKLFPGLSQRDRFGHDTFFNLVRSYNFYLKRSQLEPCV